MTNQRPITDIHKYKQTRGIKRSDRLKLLLFRNLTNKKIRAKRRRRFLLRGVRKASARLQIKYAQKQRARHDKRKRNRKTQFSKRTFHIHSFRRINLQRINTRIPNRPSHLSLLKRSGRADETIHILQHSCNIRQLKS